MSTPTINLPPGYELEQDDSSGIKLPPGYVLEHATSPEVKPPPGFVLEHDNRAPEVKLPPGFKLEQRPATPQIKLPPGFELEQTSSTPHAAGRQIGLPPGQQSPEPRVGPSWQPVVQKLSAPVPPKARSKAAPTSRVSSGSGSGQTNRTDSDADTLKFFEDAYSKFFDSDQSQSSSQNPPSTGQVGTHSGDRSWANAPPEVIARVHPPQANRSTAPPGSVQNPAQRPGAVSRFTDNMGQAMGVPPVMSDYWEGPKMAVTHPIESAKLLTEAGNQAEQDLIDKAYWYQHQPGFWNKVNGLGYGIYSLLPSGPTLAHSGEQYQQHDFAGGNGTMFGAVLPWFLGAKGSFREPSFGFQPGDRVVLPNGRPGKVQKVFPRIGVARVETESGPRTIRFSRLQSADIPVLDAAAQLQAKNEVPALQLHPGDQLILKDGRSATFQYRSARQGMARVYLSDGHMAEVRLDETQIAQPTVADTEIIVAYSSEFQIKVYPSHQEIFHSNDASPRRLNNRQGPEWDFQRKTCGPIEHRLEGAGEKVWADGPITSEGLALDAKFVKKPRRSPFIQDSNMPYDIRGLINQRVEREFRRYAAVIRDPNTPIVGLRVITNDRRAVPYLRSLMDKYRIPGRIVLRRE